MRPLSHFARHLALTALVALSATSLAPGQIVQVVGDPQQPTGQLDLDNPLVAIGLISPTAPEITASGLASVELTGTWVSSPHIVNPSGNAVGHGFYPRNGVLAVLGAGLPCDVNTTGFGSAGYAIRTQVPVQEFGLLFTNERYLRYRVELMLAGNSLGTANFSFGDLFEAFETHDRVTWSASGPFDEIRITLTSGLKHFGIDQLLWTSLGAPIGTRVCSPAVPNSSGAPAQLDAVGTGLAGSPLELVASQLPQQSFGFFLASRDTGYVAQPGNSLGVLCLGGSIGRFVGPGQLKNSGASGEFTLLVDTGAMPSPIGFVPVVSGDDWTFTAWFRDVAAGGFATSNFTDAVTVTFQ